MSPFEERHFVSVRLEELPPPRFSATDVVVHDLRNVLATISGHTQLLDCNAIAGGEARRKVILGCRRAESLLQHLLHPALSESRFNPAMHLTKVAPQLHGLVHSQTELKIEICPTASVVRGYTDLFEQIVFNLVANASEAVCSGRGKITVSLCPGRSQTTLEIVDNGPGLDMRHLRKLFEPGYSTKRPRSGLGLSIVAEAVRQLRGELRIASNGSGTAFNIALPTEREAPLSAGVDSKKKEV